MSLITKPKLENRQFEQPENSILDMSGTTNFLGVLKSKGVEIDASISGDTINFDDYALVYDNETGKIILKDIRYGGTAEIITTVGEGVTYTIDHDINYIGVLGDTVTINLPLEPIEYIEYTITDLRGDAETTPITINGNGKLINGETSAIIDTNYGSFTFKYSGSFWYIISLYF